MRRYFHYHWWRFRQYSNDEKIENPKTSHKSNVPEEAKALYVVAYFIFSFVGMGVTLSLGEIEVNGLAIFLVNLICLVFPTLLLYGLLSAIFDYKSRKIRAIFLCLFSLLYLITGTNMVLLDFFSLSKLTIDQTYSISIAFIVLVVLWCLIFVSILILLPYCHKRDILLCKKEDNEKQIEMNLSKIKFNAESPETETKLDIPKNKGENDDMETKREKFVKLTELRTNKIIETLRLLGNCSNSYMYEYSDEDVEKIFTAIENEVADCKKKFKGIKIQKFKL